MTILVVIFSLVAVAVVLLTFRTTHRLVRSERDIEELRQRLEK